MKERTITSVAVIGAGASGEDAPLHRQTQHLELTARSNHQALPPPPLWRPNDASHGFAFTSVEKLPEEPGSTTMTPGHCYGLLRVGCLLRLILLSSYQKVFLMSRHR